MLQDDKIIYFHDKRRNMRVLVSLKGVASSGMRVSKKYVDIDTSLRILIMAGEIHWLISQVKSSLLVEAIFLLRCL
jgi:hypothetical protein